MKAGCTHKDTMQQQRHYSFSDSHPPFTADKTTPNTAAIHRLASLAQHPHGVVRISQQS